MKRKSAEVQDFHGILKVDDDNGQAFIHTVRTSGEKFISSLHCVAKKEKSKRVPELGGRELTDLSPDVLKA